MPFFTNRMDIEHLTKSQIVLLTLLVTIVSSATTGIVTVSLMGQAPPAVAASVGGIIERTVQQVVFATSTPAAGKPSALTAAVALPAPSAANAIAAVQKSIIRIVVQGDMSQKTVARGVIVGSDGSAITDSSSLNPKLSYEAILNDGSKASIALNGIATSSAVAQLALVSTSTDKFPAAAVAGASTLRLGESVVRLGGVDTQSAAEGIIATLPDKNEPHTLQADIDSTTPGAILISLSGSVIGITTAQSLTLGQNYYTLVTNH